MKRKSRKRKLLLALVVIFIFVALGLGGYMIYGTYKLSQLSRMSAEEMITYTTKNNKNAKITIGILQHGEMTYTVYGENGKILPQETIEYEIGSITKTITASLLAKAVSEGKVRMEDSIDRYLNLPEKDHYPTLESLVTHTSGYKSYYFETPMIANFLNRRNDFYGISENMLIQRIGKVDLQSKNPAFKYSNFGMATIGLVLENVYNEDYTSLMNRYLNEELGLVQTTLPNDSNDLKNAWQWSPSDAYLPAGALRSTILDMMAYAQMHLKEDPEYLALTHRSLRNIDASSKTREKMGIRLDEIGYCWIIDTQRSILWHNGGTGNYNSYIGLDRNNQIAVIVLSNLPPNEKIPATVVGIEILDKLQKEATN